MNPLCEIDDPEEIAELMVQVRGKGIGSGKFGSIFGKAGEEFEDVPADGSEATDSYSGMVEEREPAPSGGLGKLSEKIRKMARDLNKKP